MAPAESGRETSELGQARHPGAEVAAQPAHGVVQTGGARVLGRDPCGVHGDPVGPLP